MNALIIFAKYPAPGSVKTRLGKQIGYQLSSDLYRIFLDLTFELVRGSGADQIYVTYEPAEKYEAFRKIIPDDFKLFLQRGDDLGHKLIDAYKTAFDQKAKKVIMLGSDSPTLPAKFIDEAFERLDDSDLVLGPAKDGGYYLIGAKQTHLSLFGNMEWSTDSVLKSTVARAKNLDIQCHLLEKWYDVDDLKSLRRAAKDDSSGRIQSHLRRNLKI